MATFTDPQFVAFSNDVVRPLSADIRRLKAAVDSALVSWSNRIVNLLPANVDDILDDGRANQGVTPLSGRDFINIVERLTAIQTLLNAAGSAKTVERPCVKPLAV